MDGGRQGDSFLERLHFSTRGWTDGTSVRPARGLALENDQRRDWPCCCISFSCEERQELAIELGLPQSQATQSWQGITMADAEEHAGTSSERQLQDIISCIDFYVER